MGVRGAIATGAGRLVHWALHDVLRRSASQLPGRVTLALDPDAIAHLRSKVRAGSIVVCGTNGKTTTTGLIASSLEMAGLRVLCNRDGANMAAGVTAALLPGRMADWAVLEADELSSIHILPRLRPRYLLLLNLFRDQLDRAGEIDHVQDVLVAALESSPETTLVVCGDDPLACGVALRVREAGTRVLAFGMTESLGLPPDRVPEARFCQRCGTELAYAWRSYAQLGAYACPTCGFARPELGFAASGVRVGTDGVALTVRGPKMVEPWSVHVGLGGAYMAYNLLAVAAASSLAGVGVRACQRALDAYHPHNGRLQHFVVEGREVVLNLAKNPTGLNQNISLLCADKRDKAVYVVVNDDYNDGRDVSWIWDVDFERLVSGVGVARMLAGGHRAHDVRVRLKYAGLEAQVAGGVGQALACVADLPATCPLYVLANYSALRPCREELERREDHHG